jgi:hypothetical protein
MLRSSLGFLVAVIGKIKQKTQWLKDYGSAVCKGIASIAKNI